MVRTSTAHADHAAIDSLFRLVTNHLECPMGALTRHGTQSDHPDILAVFNMADPLVSRIAWSVQQSAGFDNWLADSIAQPRFHFGTDDEYLEEPARRISRVTFVCQVEHASFLALSVCQIGADRQAVQTRAAQEIHGWVDAHLKLLWQMKRDRGRADVLGQALDLFDFGTLLLDPAGNIIFANDRAQQLLDVGEGLRRAGQSVTATDFDNALRLQTAIQHLAHCDGNMTVSETERASLMLMRRSNARPLVVILSRLSDTASGNGGSATALYVLDPDVDTQPLVMALCRAYGLTATEACLVIRLVEGLTIDIAAHDMHIRTQTARAYLKQIFAKTNTHRQADLVRVILGGVVRIRSSVSLPSNGGNDSTRLGAEHAPVWG